MDDGYYELLRVVRDYWQPIAIAVELVILTCALIVWKCCSTGTSQNDQKSFLYDTQSEAVNVTNSRHYYTEEEAADTAIATQGLTILLTDTGKMTSFVDGKKHSGRHVVEEFLDDRSISKRRITAIWMKNSPCLRCTERMNRECPPMKVYIGHVYCEQDRITDQERRKEIQEMKQKGFTFAAWELYCKKVGNLEDTEEDILYKL